MRESPATEERIGLEEQSGTIRRIRREYEFGVGTIKGVARKLGVHRRMVREAVASALPPPRKKPARRRAKLAPAVGFIDRILKEDRKAPRKQRHTAHRIWNRIREETSCEVAERTVPVRSRAQARVGIGEARDVRAAKLRRGHESWAEMDGERVKLQVFTMRSMASGAAFHRAYRRATQGVSGSARAGLGLLWRGVSDIER